MYDLLIKNGLVADGSGAPLQRADVAVRDGRIACVAPGIGGEAKEVVDAAGLIVSPGFIDTHSHDDITILLGLDARAILEQGITTEIAGNCGFSLTPFVPETMVDDLGGEIPPAMEALQQRGGDLAALLEMLREQGTFVNIAFLVGHGTIRGKIMGLDNRAPTEAELEAMKELLRKELRAGALGFTTGLIYPPCCYAGADELVELAKAAAEFPGAIYASHMRNESYEEVAAVQETLELGRASGLPVHISHHKIAGRGNEGMSRTTLRMVNDARARGQRVTLDAYPYDGGATALINALPPKHRSMGPDALLEKLKEPAFRAQVRAELEVVPTDFENLIGMCGMDRILIIGDDGNATTVAQQAAAHGKDPYDEIFDLIVESKGAAGAIYRMISVEDMHNILRHPLVMVGTDASSGELSPAMHPRFRATFPRFLTQFCRDNPWLTLEEGIRKTTGLPADTFGLCGKGYVREGMDADLVLFDYGKLQGAAAYGRGDTPNEGIKAVYIGGTCAVWDGAATGAKAGRTVLRGRR